MFLGFTLHSFQLQEDYDVTATTTATAVAADEIDDDNGHSNVPNTEKRFACDICDKKFNRAPNLSKHRKNVHRTILSHACDQCGRRFAFAEDLQNHKIYHTGERRYCDLCDKSFTWASSLKKHKKKFHQKLREFTCHRCDKRFYSGYELKRHSVLHTGILMYLKASSRINSLYISNLKYIFGCRRKTTRVWPV